MATWTASKRAWRGDLPPENPGTAPRAERGGGGHLGYGLARIAPLRTMNNLNTHKLASLYEASAPEEAKRIAPLALRSSDRVWKNSHEASNFPQAPGVARAFRPERKMMRFALTLFIAGSPFGITDATNAVEDEPLVVPHLFSIDAPGEGFKWEEAKSGEVKGIKFRVYAGTKEGSTSRVSLTVQQHSAEREATKIAVIKGHYNGMIESLRDAGLTDLRGERPSLESPIPEKVAYSISATGPDGQPAFIEAATVFKKHVYFIQAYADSAQEAERLVKAVETLKEDP